MSADTKMLTLEDVAKMLKTSVAKVRELRRQHKLRYYRLNHRVYRFDRKDVEQFMQQRKAGAR